MVLRGCGVRGRRVGRWDLGEVTEVDRARSADHSPAPHVHLGRSVWSGGFVQNATSLSILALFDLA
jgi:hypothetical protein